MRKQKWTVVHYLNQFFGQVGGEDRADTGFIVREGAVGPGLALKKALGERAEVAATLICGDNYFSKDPDKHGKEGARLIESCNPDLFFAGPAFEAGRYGVSCGAICKAVGERLGIPVITGMHENNPGVEMYSKYAFICKTGASARDMVASLNRMVRLGVELVSGQGRNDLFCRENLPRPRDYDYFSRLILRNEVAEKTVAERSVDKLLAKLKGEPFESEVVPPRFEEVNPAPPIKDPARCEIALVSDGGLVPKGNPDRLTGKANLRWAMYELDSLLPPGEKTSGCEIMHTGYFQKDVLEDPNRLIPADALRDLVKEGKIGKLHPTFFSTSGNATVSKRCAEMGDEIGVVIKNRGIDAAILTST